MPTDADQADRASADPRRRRRNVWLSLLASMTAVGALLLTLQDRPLTHNEGLALVATGSPAASSIEAVFQTRAPLDEQRWRGVVIHHSGSMYGSASTLDAQHRANNLHGLAYHFVIGNGAGADNGELHVGYRWLEQLPGAYAPGHDGSRYNHNFVGICLIGDGNRRPFTQAQVRRLTQLVAALQRRLQIAPENVLLGRDLSATTSPGRLFPETAFHEHLQSMILDG